MGRPVNLPDKIGIAGFQIDVAWGQHQRNLENMSSWLSKLDMPNCFLAIFPECSLCGYCCDSREETWSLALTRDDPLIDQAASIARTFNLNLVFGFLERDDEAIFNTAVLATRSGARHFYRKTHLPCLGADQFTSPGNDLSVIDVEGVRIGLGICYDCSFPETARVQALAGADLIVLPTNWPPGADTTADCVPNARALENHVYFAAVNRVGEERGFRFIGKSRFCHPNGHDLDFANHDREAVLMAEIEPGVARDKHLVRVPGKHHIDRLADRRPDLYQEIVDPVNIP